MVQVMDWKIEVSKPNNGWREAGILPNWNFFGTQFSLCESACFVYETHGDYDN